MISHKGLATLLFITAMFVLLTGIHMIDLAWNNTGDFIDVNAWGVVQSRVEVYNQGFRALHIALFLFIMSLSFLIIKSEEKFKF